MFAVCLPVPQFLDCLIYTLLKTIGTIYTPWVFSCVNIHTCAIYIFKYTHAWFFSFSIYTRAYYTFLNIHTRTCYFLRLCPEAKSQKIEIIVLYLFAYLSTNLNQRRKFGFFVFFLLYHTPPPLPPSLCSVQLIHCPARPSKHSPCCKTTPLPPPFILPKKPIMLVASSQSCLNPPPVGRGTPIQG